MQRNEIRLAKMKTISKKSHFVLLTNDQRTVTRQVFIEFFSGLSITRVAIQRTWVGGIRVFKGVVFKAFLKAFVKALFKGVV